MSHRFELNLPTRVAIGVILMLALVIAQRALAQRAKPTQQEIEALRRELQEKQRERERLDERRELVPWVDMNEKPFDQIERDYGYLRLRNEMDGFNAIWTLVPAQAEENGIVPEKNTEAVVVPLCFRGDQWLRLRVGSWLIQLEAGQAGADRALTMAPRAVKLEPGHAYSLELGELTEQRMKAILREMEKPAVDPDAPADVEHE